MAGYPYLKGNRNVRSDMGFFLESVDLYLVSTFGSRNGQNKQGTCQGCFCKKVVRPWGPFGCPLRLESSWRGFHDMTYFGPGYSIF